MEEIEVVGSLGSVAYVDAVRGRVHLEFADCGNGWDGSPAQVDTLIEALEKAEEEVKKNLTVKKDQL